MLNTIIFVINNRKCGDIHAINRTKNELTMFDLLKVLKCFLFNKKLMQPSKSIFFIHSTKPNQLKVLFFSPFFGFFIGS